MVFRNALFVVLNLFFCLGAIATPYVPLTADCDGYPKLPLGTLDGLCVGLLAQRNADIPIKIPRSAVDTPDGKLLVVDMGAWMPNKGKLWLIDYRAKIPKAQVLLTNLNLPHKILRAAEGKYYLAEASRIIQFELEKESVLRQITVVDNLPHGEGYLHPLKNFVFDKDNNIIVNIGSRSDQCEQKNADCSDGAQAGLWRFNYLPEQAKWDKNYHVLASGLRNSMAIAAHASGSLLQGENSMDFPGPDEPYEEINIIQPGAFYGWPTCYNRTATTDSAQKECTRKPYTEPWSLMPPHVAPLDALYYQHSKLPQLSNKLLMSWHGYKVVGHRLVAFSVDEQGRPLRINEAHFNSDPLNAQDTLKTLPFTAKGGVGLVAQQQEIISRWNEIPGIRPKGAPVGLSVLNDGSLIIVDDKNAALLRLSTGSAYQEVALKNDDKKTPKAITQPVGDILKSRCARCHEQLQNSADELLNATHWLATNNGVTRLEEKLFEDKLMPMPPDNSLLPAEKEQLKLWLKTLAPAK